MTYPVNYKTNPLPVNYSGVTIQITNPSVNTCPNGTVMSGGCIPQEYCNISTANCDKNLAGVLQNQLSYYPGIYTAESYQAAALNQNDKPVQAYPPQYYLNNYNYNSTPQSAPLNNQNREEQKQITDFEPSAEKSKEEILPEGQKDAKILTEAELDNERNMKASNEIISTLNERAEKEKELRINGEQKKIVALTNEYIMSLENYLNNPNSDIRLMAAKEILTRLDEDKSRYDDAALNALLNKMLQDPDQLVRIAALSALNSQLASGNNYTVQILTKIQQNPDSDREDVLEASEILLKMTTDTDVKYEPVKIKTTVVKEKAENEINNTNNM